MGLEKSLGKYSNFDPKKKHDLLIMHDGQNLFDGTKTWNGQEWELDEWASKLISENELISEVVTRELTNLAGRGVALLTAVRFLDMLWASRK